MASRLRRTHSSQELLSNVRRAKRWAEKYGVDEANPDEFIEGLASSSDQFDDLLSRIK